MPWSFRGPAAAVVILSMCSLLSEGNAAPVTSEPVEPASSPDIVLDGLVLEAPFDPSMANDFGWAYANSRIPTACRDVRATFAHKVAMMDCEVRRPGDGRPTFRRALAFAGSSPGGGASLATIQGRVGDNAFSEPAPVPLPGAFLFFATALAGLGVGGTWRSRRPARAR
jgi:hypothetical protein